MMGFGMGFGWIISLLLIGLGIWLVVQVSQRQNNSSSYFKENPLDILKERYARGEISKSEYERMKKDLLE